MMTFVFVGIILFVIAIIFFGYKDDYKRDKKDFKVTITIMLILFAAGSALFRWFFSLL